MLLKKVKFAYDSRIQYGNVKRKVMRYSLLCHGLRNGFVFIHATMSWRHNDMYSSTAVDDR